MFKLYWVICLLNGLRKVCDKVVENLVTEWCEINNVFYKGQMSSRRKRSAINAMARIISRVKEG